MLSIYLFFFLDLSLFHTVMAKAKLHNQYQPKLFLRIEGEYISLWIAKFDRIGTNIRWREKKKYQTIYFYLEKFQPHLKEVSLFYQLADRPSFEL